jgi:hypothetical protein
MWVTPVLIMVRNTSLEQRLPDEGRRARDDGHVNGSGLIRLKISRMEYDAMTSAWVNLDPSI